MPKNFPQDMEEETLRRMALSSPVAPLAGIPLEPSTIEEVEESEEEEDY